MCLFFPKMGKSEQEQGDYYNKWYSRHLVFCYLYAIKLAVCLVLFGDWYVRDSNIDFFRDCFLFSKASNIRMEIYLEKAYVHSLLVAYGNIESCPSEILLIV